jgi:hypothetical protein
MNSSQVFKTDSAFYLSLSWKSVTTCFLILNVSLGKVTLCCGYVHKLQPDCPWSKGTEENNEQLESG